MKAAPTKRARRPTKSRRIGISGKVPNSLLGIKFPARLRREFCNKTVRKLTGSRLGYAIAADLAFHWAMVFNRDDLLNLPITVAVLSCQGLNLTVIVHLAGDLSVDCG
jgi:hypothetical protein